MEVDFISLEKIQSELEYYLKETLLIKVLSTLLFINSSVFLEHTTLLLFLSLFYSLFDILSPNPVIDLFIQNPYK